MEIEVLYQDEHFIAVNKPSGMLVHPYYKECGDTETLMKFVKMQTGLYLYPMHRLDRPVSGIVLFALDPETVKLLQNIWNTDQVEKTYLTLVRRVMEEDEGVFDFTLKNENGVEQEAITYFKVLEKFLFTSFVEVKLKTGRMHQIRRHFSRRCYNLVGDTRYGKGKLNQYFRDQFNLHRIFLHATKLKFFHPHKKEMVEIHCPLPEQLQAVISGLRSQSEFPRELQDTRLFLKNDDIQKIRETLKAEKGELS